MSARDSLAVIQLARLLFCGGKIPAANPRDVKRLTWCRGERGAAKSGMRIPLVTFYIEVAAIATAGGTHGLLLFNFQTRDMQSVVSDDIQTCAAALRAASYAMGKQLDVLLTVLTPAFRLLFFQMQPAAFGQGAAAHQLKAKLQRAAFHTGKSADAQPDIRHPFRVMLMGLLFDQFQRLLAEGNFVHCAIPGGVLPGKAILMPSFSEGKAESNNGPDKDDEMTCHFL